MAIRTVRKGRDCTFTVTIYETSGDEYTYASGDVIRVKIGRSGQTPILDLSSKAATANGSNITQDNPCTVVLRAADTELLPVMVLELEVVVVDDSDKDKVLHADDHIINVLDRQGGEVSV